ncbi:hypothetical protein ACWY4P_40555 [Streptomyces sp. LZ34]
MTTHMDRFREALEGAVEDALAKAPEEVVTAVWNACDDERGRLLEENENLRAQLKQLNAAANRALDSLNAFITDTSDPGVEALGARYELRNTLVERLPHSPEPEVHSVEQQVREQIADEIKAAIDRSRAHEASLGVAEPAMDARRLGLISALRIVQGDDRFGVPAAGVRKAGE